MIQGRTPERTDGKKDKHYIVVRDDLPVGLLAAQVCHAAGESAALRSPPNVCHAVVLSASKQELDKLDTVLRWEKIPFRAVFENDPPYENELLAIGIAPCTEGLGRWLRHLPLLGQRRPDPP